MFIVYILYLLICIIDKWRRQDKPNRRMLEIPLCVIALLYIIKDISFSYTTIIFFLISFFVSPWILLFTYKIVQKEWLWITSYYKKFSFKLSLVGILEVIQEEIVWRVIPVGFFGNHWFVNLLIVLITNVIFVYTMHDIQSKRQGLEMSLYSLFFWTALILPGTNYGLHFGRNNYVLFLRENEAK